jgi:hypothetical protein
MRPSSNVFSGFSTTPRKASWDDLSRGREADGETKNYSVPPELIELARANRKGRGQVGTLTPLAPKPPEDVVVVVPAAAPLARDIAPATGSDPESSLRVGAPVMPSPVPTSPLAELMRAELAAAAGDDERQPNGESMGSQPASSVAPGSVAQASVAPGSVAPGSVAQASTSPRRSSRRARRSLRIEMPVEATTAARAAAAAETPRIYSYVAYATGAVLVGGYITLCYYANALLSGLP